jgi:hypothetical protein
MATMHSALFASLIIFFLLCGVKAVLRIDWLAAIVASVMLAMQEGTVRESATLGLDMLIYVAIFSMFAFMLLRLGMVSSVAGVVFVNTATRVQLGPEFTSWINGAAVAEMLLLIVIAVFAFWRSQTCPQPQTMTSA